jgi:hypothetical protein
VALPGATLSPITGGRAFRIRKGDFIGSICIPMRTITYRTFARVIYDDGRPDLLQCPNTTATAGGTQVSVSNKRAELDGWVISVFVWLNGSTPAGGAWCEMFILEGDVIDQANVREMLAEGFVGGGQQLVLGVKMPKDFAHTYIFQGTVASDATVGTHVSTCSFTFPGAGGISSEAQLVCGQIVLAGAAGLAINAILQDDSGNNLYTLRNETTAGTWNFPYSAAAAGGVGSSGAGPVYISGAMTLVLTATTSTVSQTQTFSLQVRLKSTVLPTVTLADNVGTPVITNNTAKVI